MTPRVGAEPRSLPRRADAGERVLAALRALRSAAARETADGALLHARFRLPAVLEPLELWPEHGPRVFWRPRIDDSRRTAEPPALGVGAAVLLRARGSERFESIREQAEDVLERVLEVDVPGGATVSTGGARFFGGFSFRSPGPGAAWRDFGAATFLLPEILVEGRRREGERESLLDVSVAVPAGADLHRRLARIEERLLRLARSRVVGARSADPIDVSRWSTPADGADYAARVDRALVDCEAGALDKVVVARQRKLRLPPGPERNLIERLWAGDPTATGFAFGFERALFLGVTPERLLRLRGRQLRTEALAGTRRRESPGVDAVPSAKDDREHGIVVDDVLRRLAPRCTVLETGPRRRRDAGPVVHLHTAIHGVVGSATHVLDLVADLHPTPAVGGLPRERALDWLARHEDLDRGWYAAPVGWFGHGAGEFSVALRCGLLHPPTSGARTLDLYAGAGIVHGSIPTSEVDETECKLSALPAVLSGAGPGEAGP